MKTINLIVAAAMLVLFASCGGGEAKEEGAATAAPESMVKAEAPSKDLGVGSIKSVELAEIDPTLVATGMATFEAKCTACHKIGKRFVGPDLTGVVSRREPEWIMNMILNPELMVKENEVAKQLLMEYSAPMANQNLTEEEARGVLEYFRTL